MLFFFFKKLIGLKENLREEDNLQGTTGLSPMCALFGGFTVVMYWTKGDVHIFNGIHAGTLAYCKHTWKLLNGGFL